MENFMHGLKPALAACGLALFAAVPAVAEDLTILLGYSGANDRSNRGVTTLFISSNDVRYRTRNYYYGNKDWLFNVTSGKLVVIDHDRRQYSESTAQEREEVRRLEREEAEARRLPHLQDGKLEMRSVPRAHHESIFVEKGSEKRQYAGYGCEQYVISTDIAVGPLLPSRRDRMVAWWVTGDVQAPAFFKFQDAVIEQESVPDVLTWRWAFAQAYDEIRSKGLFPLGASPAVELQVPPLVAFFSTTPTYGALDMLFHPTSWGAGSVSRGPVNPAIFTIVAEDSILSPVLPASYRKGPSLAAGRIASLKDTIELNKKSSQEAYDKVKGLLDMLGPLGRPGEPRPHD
jgi:hypothetical protein